MKMEASLPESNAEGRRNDRGQPVQDANCEKHGPYVSTQFFGKHWSSCSQCVKDDEAQRKLDQETAERAERTARRKSECGIGSRFEAASFENYRTHLPEQQRVARTCRDYAETVDFNAGSGLWLIGQPGTGKTHLGSAMVNHVIEQRNAGAMIYSAREIVSMLRCSWRKDNTRGWPYSSRPWTEDSLIDDLGHIPLLVIDEVGGSFNSEGEHVQLFDVIDLRYELRRPTVLLSNLPAAGIKAALGDRSYDRLREGAKLLACTWESHRGKALRGA
jgi:DNA replication protein DnaC